jgi:carbon storage regulator CsrA
MLVLTRKPGEIVILDLDGREISVHILHTSTGRVSLGVDAPRDIKVRRGELSAAPAKIAGLIG